MLRTKYFVSLATAVLLLIALVPAAFAAYEKPAFNHPLFEQTWVENDQEVLDGTSALSWTWGPAYEPGRFVGQEDYVEAPNGVRTVQYFDKSRMEDNSYRSSGQWAVTNGLLVVELVTGRMQMGDNTFVQRAPSNTPVAGDPNQQNVLTYADLAQQFNPGGYEWDPVFTDFLAEHDGLYTVGLASSPPIETEVMVAGTLKTVIVQAGQRRVLTYTEDNPTAFQVEWGNVGQHYFNWRYGDNNDGGTPPPPTDTPKHGQGMSLENCTEYQVTSFTVCASTSKGNVRVNGNVLTFTHERGPLGEAAIAMEIRGNGAVQISGNPVISVWSLDEEGNIYCDNCQVTGKAVVVLDDDVERIYIGSVGPVGFEVTFTFAPSPDGLEGTVINP